MNGVLIIDKPAGMSSHDVVARVRKILGERRVGHTGTLDPFATGVLVVLVGKTTRLAQFLSSAEKEYEAVIRLGYATDSGDRTGRRVSESEFHAKAQSAQSIRKEDIEVAIQSLRGEIAQIPPMYSAKKVKGEKLYELARRGEEIERASVAVTISAFESLERNGRLLKENEDGTHDLAARVVCSAGTYIRTLAEDFGRKLGIGTHLAELRRTRAGQFRIESAITLDRLAELADSDSIETELISADVALADLPLTELNSAEVARTVHGIDLEIDAALDPAWPDKQPIRLRGAEGQLIAVGVYDQARRVVHPKVVLFS